LSKRIAILGSTGSIGRSSLEVVEHLGQPWRATALSGHGQIDRLLEQVRQHRPAAVAVTDPLAGERVARDLANLDVQFYRGQDGLCEMVRRDDVDIVLAAIVGAAGVGAVLSAVQAGKTIALANKEALVVAGSLIMPTARRQGVTILPVDSEHSAVFQAMQAGRRSEVKRVILTASGGPFRTTPLHEMRRAGVQQALNHPTWKMGSKITIDSATMFNKSLELVEACWLFDLRPDQLEVVIHPESVVHSMVEFVDGSVLAQLSPPDMRTPIQYALTYPERRQAVAATIDWRRPCAFNFEPVDMERFPALRLAYDVAERGGTLGAVLNAANESAVEAFLSGRIPFGVIYDVVELTIARHRLQSDPSLDDLMEADQWARQQAARIIQEKKPAPDLSQQNPDNPKEEEA
jgi:1-deoxy-D-xylulose-5-phosphate reductoisomerase